MTPECFLSYYICDPTVLSYLRLDTQAVSSSLAMMSSSELADKNFEAQMYHLLYHREIHRWNTFWTFRDSQRLSTYTALVETKLFTVRYELYM